MSCGRREARRASRWGGCWTAATSSRSARPLRWRQGQLDGAATSHGAFTPAKEGLVGGGAHGYVPERCDAWSGTPHAMDGILAHGPPLPPARSAVFPALGVHLLLARALRIEPSAEAEAGDTERAVRELLRPSPARWRWAEWRCCRSSTSVLGACRLDLLSGYAFTLAARSSTSTARRARMPFTADDRAVRKHEVRSLAAAESH